MFVVDPGAFGIARGRQGGEGGEGRADQVAIAAKAAFGTNVSALAERLGNTSAAETMLRERDAMGAHPHELTATGRALMVERPGQPAGSEGGAGASPTPEPEADV